MALAATALVSTTVARAARVALPTAAWQCQVTTPGLSSIAGICSSTTRQQRQGWQQLKGSNNKLIPNRPGRTRRQKHSLGEQTTTASVVSAGANLEVCIDDVGGSGTSTVQLNLILHPSCVLGCCRNQLQPVCCCVVCLQEVTAVSLSQVP